MDTPADGQTVAKHVRPGSPTRAKTPVGRVVLALAAYFWELAYRLPVWLVIEFVLASTAWELLSQSGDGLWQTPVAVLLLLAMPGLPLGWAWLWTRFR